MSGGRPSAPEEAAAVPATRRRGPRPRGKNRGYQPADVLVLVYFLITGLLLLATPHAFTEKSAYATAHFTFLLLVALLYFVPREGSPILRFFRDWYFFMALPFLYGSVRYLNRLFTLRYFDGDLVRIEQSLFASQPSQTLHEMLPWAPLSEFLHLSYLLYLSLVPLVGLTLYCRGRLRPYREFATTTLLTYFCCYLIFILIPVRGPFHFFGPLDPAPAGGFFASLAQGMLHNVSSSGTAFPSSHVAAAAAIWMVSRRYQRWLSWIVGILAAGILVGTVYGGFHYAIDALAGLLVGLVLGNVGPRLHALLAALLDQRLGD